MPARIQLVEGDFVDPDKNLIYIKEAGTNSSRQRMIGVYDVQYDEYFEASLNDIRRGHTKHSLKTSYMLRGKQRVQWSSGETRIINNEPILFLKELEPFVYTTPKGTQYKVRRGRFQNLNTNIVFECDVSSARAGSSSGTKKSRGERLIESILLELNMEYQTQYIFYDCRNKNNRILYFDFYLPDYNCCIEYDGEQHVLGWKRDKNTLKQIMHNDSIKDSYCKEKAIKLIRISYKDFNKIDKNYLIDKILN